MGFVARGILVYGFEIYGSWMDFLEENSWEEDMVSLYEDDFDEFVEKVYDIEKIGYPEKTRVLKEIGITFECHGHHEEAAWILTATDSIKSVAWGSTVELGQTIAAQPEWREKIMKFCEKAKMKFFEPEFILCSSYG